MSILLNHKITFSRHTSNNFMSSINKLDLKWIPSAYETGNLVGPVKANADIKQSALPLKPLVRRKNSKKEITHK
jgi:hypothetical protein